MVSLIRCVHVFVHCGRVEFGIAVVLFEVVPASNDQIPVEVSLVAEPVICHVIKFKVAHMFLSSPLGLYLK